MSITEKSRAKHPFDTHPGLMVGQAYRMARQYHEGQRYGTQDYLVHLGTVAFNVKGIKLETVAWLHDIVEDTDCSLDDICSIFGREIAEAVDAITQHDGEDYESYIRRAGSNEIARKVKLADLVANLSASVREPNKHNGRDRVARYAEAIKYLVSLEPKN